MIGADSRGWIPAPITHESLLEAGQFIATLERVVRWNDPEVGIKWPPAIQPLLTDRDAHAAGRSAITESELTPI